MKLYHWLVAIVFLASVQTMHAQSYYHGNEYDCCYESDACCSETKGSIYGDFLWWKLNRIELDFSFQNEDTRFIKPKYNSGFRIGGVVACKCLDFGVRYTSFSTDGSKQSPNSEDENLKYRFDYNVVDFEIGFNIPVCCLSGGVRPFAGVKLAEVDERLNFRDINGNLLKLNYDGVGLYLGAEGKFHLNTWKKSNCCWSVPTALHLRGSGCILDGENDHKNIFGSQSRRKECTYCSVYELYAGAELELRDWFRCANPTLRIGYHTEIWTGWRVFSGNDDIVSFGLGGLVLGLEAGF